MPKQTLVLIDGNAIMHRAFHALPPLTNKDGDQINAVYGFLTMMLTIIDKLSPSHMAVCFDRPEPTFRKSMYVGYQAKRPKMDDALSTQFDTVKEVLAVLHVPIYEMPGYEADDVIGTLATQADMNVVIITGDRDILQLVDDRVNVYMPVQGLSNGKLYGVAEVEKKLGIPPEKIVDYKGLAGDPSDNYPGVRGIGAKTACSLLETFGSVDGVYKAIAEKDERAQALKPRVLKALSEYAEDASISKELAQIKTDAPVTLVIQDASLDNFGAPEAIKALAAFGFSSIVRRLEQMSYSDEIVSGIAPNMEQKPEKKQQKEDPQEQMSLL